ncbi:protein transporter sec23 [Batrachochytrium salamandrivorans]|nr:protein transporter sec23 [Batrachochytrium salamandrivorans]
MPLELMQEYLSIEYVLNKNPGAPPVFLYVVDTCLDEEDLKALRDSLIVSLNLLPQHALVSLITFGTMAQIHELGFSDCPKSYVFRGSKDHTGKQIQEMLGMTGGVKPQQPVRPGQPAPPQAASYSRSWPVANDRRPLRCTGTALSVAVGLIEAAYLNGGARIMLFLGGACTEGPGLIVGHELRERLRSHNDLEKMLQNIGKRLPSFTSLWPSVTSRELKVCGLIGPAISANKKSACVGETEISIAGTNAWKFCGITSRTSCAVYFEVATQVTTIPRVWTEPTSPTIPAAFDQEASAVLMAELQHSNLSMDAPVQPVLLDSVSMQPNVILLLDTYFHILIWHGETIAAWRKAKYHEDPTYGF